MRVLIDADFILEAVINRVGWREEVKLLWYLMESKLIQAYITDMGLEKISHYVSRLKNIDIAEQVSFEIQEIMLICSVSKEQLEKARLSKLQDFESAVEFICAIDEDCGAVVSHDCRNFEGVNLSILSAQELHIRQDLIDLLIKEKHTKEAKIYLNKKEELLNDSGQRDSEDIGGLLANKNSTINYSNRCLGSENLKEQIKIFTQTIETLFEQSNQTAFGMYIDEVELSININSEGKIILCGDATRSDERGAITLKLKRNYNA